MTVELVKVARRTALEVVFEGTTSVCPYPIYGNARHTVPYCLNTLKKQQYLFKNPSMQTFHYRQ